ncbi:MAG: HEAT repeat domain-containing protein [Planctomycetes bacterium]|nr:HEAT repeat domain-containing protein [Planctomycetota bacterium]
MVTRYATTWRWAAAVLATAVLAAAAFGADGASGLASGQAGERASAAASLAVAADCPDADIALLVRGLGDSSVVRPSGAGYRTVAAGAAYRPGDTTVGTLCAEALANLADRAAGPLLAALDDPTCADAHGKIVNLLGQTCPERARPAVLRYIRRQVTTRQPWDPQLSVAWLGAEAVPVLVQALGTDVLELQVVAASDLGCLGDPRAYGPLLSVVQRLAPLAEKQPSDHAARRRIVVFRSAVVSLAQVGGPSSFQHIAGYQSQLASCWDAPTREALILALGCTGDRRAAGRLRPLLAGGDPYARRAACDALGRLGSQADEAVDPLIDLLDATDEDLSRAAGDALRAITGTDLGDDAASWRQWRAVAVSSVPSYPAVER